MKKNLWLLGLLIFIFASCNPAKESGTSDSPKDIWSDITAWDQVDGMWVGIQSKTMPLKNVEAFWKVLEAEDMLLFEEEDDEWITLIKDINVTIAVKATIIIDAGEQARSVTAKVTATFSGGNTAMFWMFFQGLSLEPEDIPGVSIDNNKHSITIDMDLPPTPITLEDMVAQFQINQNETKLKMEIDTREFGEWGELIPSEVILVKQ